ncbi:MAG: hypothetical protein HOB73_08400 [Planctomycetaceae bacterium]|jgi:hypothetical protein|nr:hypothetical protein [Planctomycetaceae bacterium]
MLETEHDSLEPPPSTGSPTVATTPVEVVVPTPVQPVVPTSVKPNVLDTQYPTQYWGVVKQMAHIFFIPFRALYRFAFWIFGVGVLVTALALAASLPIVQFVALGYLLEISRRIVKHQKVRAGFWGIQAAARAGSGILGTFLIWLPAYFMSSYYVDATIMLPGSERAAQYGWQTALLIAITSLGTFWAWTRGGLLRHFIWPAPVRFLKEGLNRKIYVTAHNRFWEFVSQFPLRALFVSGFQGFIGTCCWLIIPVGFCIGGMVLPRGINIVCGTIGYVALAIIFLYLPMLQTRFAVEQRLGVFREIGAVRLMYQRAPLAFWISMVSVWLLALPVYLVKIELTPREVVMLPAVVFIMFAWPTRILLGWAYARAHRRETPRLRLSIWLGRLTLIPIVFAYGSIVLASRYTSWYGEWSLLEQHALLIPIPFFSF